MKFISGKVVPEISHLNIFIIVVIALFYILPLSSFAQNGDWERRINNKAHKIDGHFNFVSLQDVAEALNAQTYYSNKARKAVLTLGVERITITAYNPYVVIGQGVLQMPINTQYSKGELFVPVKFFIPILKHVLQNSGAGNNNISESDLIKQGVNITGVQVVEKTNGTLIRVNTLTKFNKSGISTRYSRRWLYVDILNGKVSDKYFSAKIDTGLVKRVVPVQSEQLVQLSFQLNKDISSKDMFVTQHENEIWISIPTKNNLSRNIIEKLKSDKEKWKIDKIVIDPGHGGRDPGTIGRSGVYEKDIVLSIAKRLKKLLVKKLKIDVFMTRDKDKYISLKERTQLANKKGGKLFISIHANWNRNSQVKGATTYFLGLAKSDEALEIAQLENAAIKYEADEKNYTQYNDESIILATMAQNDYNKESQDFAAVVQKALNKNTGINDRGIQQAGFYVLVGASMPNVLIETAFVSNRKEERLLKSSSFQQKVAQAIFESIKTFKVKYESELYIN